MKSQQSDKLFYKMGTVNNDDRKHGSKARSSIPKLLCHVQAIATLATRKSHFEVREGAKSQQLLGAAWLRAEHCTREKKLGDFQGSSFSYYLISVRHMTDWGAAAGVWHHAAAARSKCTPTPKLTAEACTDPAGAAARAAGRLGRLGRLGSCLLPTPCARRR